VKRLTDAAAAVDQEVMSASTHTEQRKPGQYGREVIRRHAVRFAVAVMAFGGLPLFLWLRLGLPTYVVAAVALAAIPTMLIADRRVSSGLERRLQGANGEEQVGAILEGMRAAGWRVLHDCVLSRGNIDHIAIGPGGLFTVETKSRRGRVDVDHIDERWLKQAYAQRKVIEAAIGQPATCLLVFSNAYLTGRPVASRRGVVVLPARLLAGHLERKRVVYTPGQIDTVFERLATAIELAGRR
jgi:Holliday junction resolvase-like predicted endonuclease